MPYAKGWRNKAYTCTSNVSKDGLKNYRFTGSGGIDGYNARLKGLAAEIAATHEAVFGTDPAESASDPALWMLWDVVTSVAPVAGSGARGAMAAYLLSGKDFDFSSAAAGAKSAAALTKTGDSKNPAAPWALSTPIGQRKVSIRRATAASASGRGLLEGGTTSTVEGRPANVQARMKILGPNVGNDGSKKMVNLREGVNGSLSILRMPGL